MLLNRRIRATLKIIAALSVCITPIILIQLKTLTSLNQEYNKAEVQINLSLDKLRLHLMKNSPVFGFSNLLSDFFFLEFLQYFGDEESREVSGYELSSKYFAVILEKDPFFIDSYNYLFTSISLYSAQPDKAVALVQKSLSQMTPNFPPRGYFIWRNKAFDELLFLNDSKQAIESLEISAEWALLSGSEEGKRVAELSQRTADFLRGNPDSRVARSLAWSSILVRAIDERSREIAMEEIRKFGGTVTITSVGAVEVFLPNQD